MELGQHVVPHGVQLEVVGVYYECYSISTHLFDIGYNRPYADLTLDLGLVGQPSLAVELGQHVVPHGVQLEVVGVYYECYAISTHLFDIGYNRPYADLTPDLGLVGQPSLAVELGQHVVPHGVQLEVVGVYYECYGFYTYLFDISYNRPYADLTPDLGLVGQPSLAVELGQHVVPHGVQLEVVGGGPCGRLLPVLGDERGVVAEGKEMFYLKTHSTHFIYGYMASDIW